MGCLKRALFILGLLILILVVTVGSWFYWMTRHPWPQIDGTLQVTGLRQFDPANTSPPAEELLYG